MTIEIEEGIPVPGRKGRPVEEGYEVVSKLEVKQSVFLPEKKAKSVTVYLRGLKFKDLRDQGYKWRCADASKDDVEGTRVWRVA